MNSMLLAGLTDHEAAAIEIMIGMNWQDQRVLTIPRGLGLGVPEQSAAAKACEQGVLDLFGFGMRRHTPDWPRCLGCARWSRWHWPMDWAGSWLNPWFRA